MAVFFAAGFCETASANDLVNRIQMTLSDFSGNWKQEVLGAGVLYATTVYEGKDDTVWGVPILVGQYKNFYVQGTDLGYILNETDQWKVSLMGKPRFNGYESDDSDALKGMEDRNWSFDAGVRVDWTNDLCVLSFNGIVDTLHEHDGQELSLNISKAFFRRSLIPHAGVHWKSQNLVDYYYGVSGDEVKASRPSYEADPAWNYDAGVRVNIPFEENWVIMGDFTYEWMGDSITDSPIVDETGAFSTLLGAAYRF